jgi:ubiquinone biosynthesis protein UbiJ
MEQRVSGPLEEVINRGIRASGEATGLCRQLSGRRLLIDPLGLPGYLAVTAEDDHLRLALTDETVSDCTIRGLPITLVRAGMSGTAGGLRQGAAEIVGDPGVAQDFQRLLDLAKPDWEEELSRVFGDMAAHQLGNLARGLVEWGRKAADTLARDGGEYLTEESRNLPTRFEVEEFLDEVDRLREDVDRFAARLERLENKQGGRPS